jgi:hypothetical protein
MAATGKTAAGQYTFCSKFNNDRHKERQEELVHGIYIEHGCKGLFLN